MQKKNVLFISSWYPTHVNPSNGNFVQRHAQAVALIHNVIVLHIIFDKQLPEFKKIEIHKKHNVIEHIIYFYLPKYLRIIKPIIYLFLYIQAYKTIRKSWGKPDIVHANILYPIGIIAMTFKIIYKLPYVCSEHWSGFLPEANGSIAPCKLFLIKRYARNASYVMPVSELLQSSMQKRGIEAHYSVVNNVVETSIFSASENISKPIHTILHVSTLKDDVKNIRGILRALCEVSKIREDFVLEVASENSPNDLLNYAKELGIKKHVKFIGYKTRPELAQALSECSFSLLFSNYETFSCVIVESFAAGKPVISSNSVGILKHITPDKGIVVETRNEKDLTEKILYMLDNYSTYNAENLHSYADSNFSYTHIALEFDTIYKSIV